ncbi:hypothetical protein [Ghiorsea bivora]|nr:hypothetical protein [Ghiorsea bivora]
MNNNLNESAIDVEDQEITLNIMRGLDDVKQGRFSDKTILDIVEDN